MSMAIPRTGAGRFPADYRKRAPVSRPTALWCGHSHSVVLVALERACRNGSQLLPSCMIRRGLPLLSREQTILKPRMLIFARRDATLRAFLLSAYLNFCRGSHPCIPARSENGQTSGRQAHSAKC
jgi:hypothetical protein